MILGNPVDDRHKFFDLFIIHSDLHPLAAQNIRRPYQYRITEPVCHCFRFFSRIDSPSSRPGNLCLLQYPVKQLPVFCRIHVLCFRPQYRNSHFHQTLCQFNSGLSAKLYHSPIRFFQIDNIFHILRRKWLEIELVCNIEIGTYCLRVIIDDNRLISGPGKSPGSMYRTVIELDSLSDSNGAGTKDKYLLPAHRFHYFILTAKTGVIIRRAGSKLRRTGVYHFKGGYDTVIIAHLSDLFF